ncbi:endo-1,4-beta-xylanase [Modicisalibacter ilicicola DSM 19980]|uniref:Beta-xylanase n=2 Tax=Modicisalibacter ilicicola TaxID=480814 RepID=A0A1M5C9X6_9GAMM|nr:endo-1,4-beta-xylanase [Halomonas ilicicola DSM 19980]
MSRAGRGWLLPVCLGLALLTSADAAAGRQGVNLLEGDWAHFAGAVLTDAGVRVEGLGRAIVPTEDADDQTPVANPPINLRGPVLRVTGDFALSARLALPSDPGGAYLTLYGELPYNQDEWRQPGRAVTLGVEDDRLIVELQDGIADPQRHVYSLGGREAAVTLGLARLGDEFEVRIDDKTVATLADPGLFDAGRLRFGASATVGSSFVLQALTARALENGRVEAIEEGLPVVEGEPQSLRRLAKKHHPHLDIGTAVSPIPLFADDAYARLLAREFSMVTPENVMKFQFIHPQPDRYAFAEADAIVEFAEVNRMAVHGHTLAWKEALPRWVTQPSHSDERLRQILAEHIAAVVGRYKGRVRSWDVVNEPFEPFGAALRSGSPWYRAMGEGYIAFALRQAHRADPEARLYINDYALEHPGPKSDAMYALAKSLLARGVPLHGIGFQMHEDMTEDYQPVAASVFRDNVQRFIDLGLEVRISEMDVNLHEDDSEERLQDQAEYFRAMLELARDEPAFTAFSMWGFTDRYSSLQEWWDADGFGNGLIFDADYRPKPAYFSLRKALRE